jgi:hypothetical protein
VRQVANIEDKENAYRLFVGETEQNRPFGKTRRRLEDLKGSWRILKKQNMMAWTAFIWLRIETSSGKCETW